MDHTTTGGLEGAVELGAVPELGRAEQPVGAAERFGQADGGGDVLALDGPHRVGHEQLVVGHPETTPGAVAIARTLVGRRSRCRSWWRRCPRSANCRRVSSLMVTWRQAGSSGGSSVTWAHSGRCQGGSWWCRMAGRPAGAAATARAAGRFSGIVHRFSTTTRSASASASSSAPDDPSNDGSPSAGDGLGARSGRSSAGRRRRCQTGDTTVDRAVAGHRDHVEADGLAAPAAQLAATIDTPSVRPRRNDTMAQVGMAAGVGRGGARRADPGRGAGRRERGHATGGPEGPGIPTPSGRGPRARQVLEASLARTGLLRAQPDDLSLAVAVGLVLPRRVLEPPGSSPTGPSPSWPTPSVPPGRRRVRPPHDLLVGVGPG